MIENDDDIYNHDADDDIDVESTSYGPVRLAAQQSLRAMVEGVVDVISWHDNYAKCTCPSGHQDAHLYLSGQSPHLHCLHENCRAEVAAVNAQLRELARNSPNSEEWASLVKPNKEAEALRKRLDLIRAQAKNRLLSHLLKTGRPVTIDEWLARSPFSLADCDMREDGALFIRAMYKQRDPNKPAEWPNESDLLWIGELWESGKEYRNNFKSVDDWLRCGGFGPQICVPPFNISCKHNGKYLGDAWQRSKNWALPRPYYVAESDTIPVAEFGIVVGHLQKYSTLRAIVDTGGKSIHCWFDVPPMPECVLATIS